MDEDEFQALLQEQGPNQPLGITGSLTGPRPHVSPEEAAKRRMLMSSAMMQGASRDQIIATFMKPPFALSESGVIELMREVRARWLEEDLENQSIERSAAKRRLNRWIAEAAKDRKWTAVAALEKVHADITGNSLPVPVADADQKTFQGVLLVLGEMRPEEFRQTVEKQRLAIDRDHLAIDTQGVEVPTTVRRSG